jgi:hypothetical protein|tara:strand:+ start:155 stop:403 length:249 start_codon:yes stop_codon:yes gene_type:complete
LRQKKSETLTSLDVGDLVHYSRVDPYQHSNKTGVAIDKGVGVITDVFYNDRSYTHMYRVLTQESGLQLWFDEDEVAILNKAP